MFIFYLYFGFVPSVVCEGEVLGVLYRGKLLPLGVFSVHKEFELKITCLSDPASTTWTKSHWSHDSHTFYPPTKH